MDAAERCLEAQLPWIYERRLVLRLQVMATLVLAILITGMVSSNVASEIVGFPVLAALGYPFVLLTGWVTFKRQLMLHRLGGQELAAGRR